MTTYYGNVRTHTLLDEKEHDPERRKGVCCRDKLTNHDVTDVERLGGTPLGIVGACSGASGALPPPLLPGRGRTKP